MDLMRSLQRFEVSAKATNIILRLLVLVEGHRADDVDRMLNNIDEILEHETRMIEGVSKGKRVS